MSGQHGDNSFKAAPATDVPKESPQQLQKDVYGNLQNLRGAEHQDPFKTGSVDNAYKAFMKTNSAEDFKKFLETATPEQLSTALKQNEKDIKGVQESITALTSKVGQARTQMDLPPVAYH